MPSNAENQYTTSSWTYRATVGFGYLSIVSIVLYEAFNLYAAFEGFETLDNLTTKLGKATVDSVGWTMSEVVVGLETGANIGLMSPAYEARRFLGIKNTTADLSEPLLVKELGEGDPEPEHSDFINLTPFGLCSLGLIVANSVLVGIAAIIPIHNAFGLNSTTIPILVPLAFLSCVYQFLFVCADTSEACDELFRGRRSVYAKLWQYSKCQFTRSFIESFLMTNIYFCVMSSYVVIKVFGEICDLPSIVLPLQITAAVANVYTLLPRHEELFRGYMQPFATVRGDYDLKKISNEDRDRAWESIGQGDRRLFVSRASMYGVLVMGVVFYFADKYSILEFSHDHHRTMLNTVISLCMGLLNFGFIFYTDWHYNMNRLTADCQENQGIKNKYSWVVKLAAGVFNFGAQFTRGICMVTFFVSVLGASFDPMDLIMMSLLTSVIVGGTNWVFYNQKLLRRFSEWEKSGLGLFKGDGNNVSPDYHGYALLKKNDDFDEEKFSSQNLMDGWGR